MSLNKEKQRVTGTEQLDITSLANWQAKNIFIEKKTSVTMKHHHIAIETVNYKFGAEVQGHRKVLKTSINEYIYTL